jgi:hypothetical protein
MYGRTIGGPDLAILIVMIVMRVTRVAIIAAIVAGLAAGCGSSPAAPSGASPQVTSVAPPQILRADAPQTVTVSGRNFVSGLTVDLTDPMGGSRTIERSDILALQPTSFQLIATLAVAGAYSLRIKKPSGDQSDPFSFVVQSQAGGNPPHIDSVSPSSVVHNASTQVIAVAGSNFSSAINVTVVDPSGQPLGMNNAIIGVVLPNAFQIGVVLTQIGTYTLYVTNPTGEVSNAVAIAVF